MENGSLHVEQKVRNIQSDYGSIDYEKAKEFHDLMMPKIVEEAREFGSNNLPVNEEYEHVLIARYSALYTEWVSDETAMAEEIRTCFHQTREDYFGTDEGHLVYEITKSKQDFARAKILLGRLMGETNASLFLLKRNWVTYVVLGCIGYLEFPLNETLFTVFNLGTIGSILLATLVVVIIPILSHLSGKFIKQRKERRANQLIGAGFGAVLVLFVLSLSVFRFKYFVASTSSAETSIISEFLAAIATVNSFGAFTDTVFWISFLLNMGLVLIGFVLGFMAHDSKDAFEKSYKEFHFRRPKLISQLSNYRQERHTNIMIQGKPFTREQELIEKMINYRRMHNALASHIDNFASYMDGLCKEAINMFRIHNQKARTDFRSVPHRWRESQNGFIAVYPKNVVPISVEAYPEMEEQFI